MKKILITQSNYIPWKGYFDSINQADIFVVFDDMQYTRRDWRNRNYIKTPQGLKWLTIPVEVKGKYFQKINETRISEPNWNINHLMQIKQNYSKAPFFKEYFPRVEELYYTATFEHLTEVNVHLLKAICGLLNIKTEFRDSREFKLLEDKTERLVSVCKDLNATEYLTGPSAKNYIEESLFKKENIEVSYFDYTSYPEYPQLYPPFEHGVCIWDLILNCGKDSVKYLNRS
jgi:hypothetical protein